MEKEKKRIKLEDFEEQGITTYEAEITGMEQGSGEDFFGEAAFNPKKQFIRLWLGDGNVRITVPMAQGLEFENGEFYVTNPLLYKRSVRNPKSKWAAFISEHGIPKVGKKIKIEV